MASLRLPPVYPLTSSGFTTQAIDASTDGAGAIFYAPKTGTITKIGVLQTAKTGTGPTYRYGVEGVTTTRAPDGTYKNAGNAYVDAADPATAFAWRTLGASVSVTAGDLIAATVRYQSGTIDGSNFITVAVRTTQSITQAHPYALTLTAGAWATSLGCPCIALQYDDGTVIFGVTAASSLTNNSPWTSASSPVYRGTKWTPGVTCQLVGCWIGARVPDTFDFNILLYVGTASSPAVTVPVVPDLGVGTNAGANPFYIPIPPTTLSSGTVYRLVIEPIAVVSPTTFVNVNFPDADALAAYWGDLKGTTGVAGSPPTWTDYDNGTDGYRAYPVIPVIDDVTASAGGGLLTHPGMSGGMRG